MKNNSLGLSVSMGPRLTVPSAGCSTVEPERESGTVIVRGVSLWSWAVDFCLLPCVVSLVLHQGSCLSFRCYELQLMLRSLKTLGGKFHSCVAVFIFFTITMLQRQHACRGSFARYLGHHCESVFQWGCDSWPDCLKPCSRNRATAYIHSWTTHGSTQSRVCCWFWKEITMCQCSAEQQCSNNAVSCRTFVRGQLHHWAHPKHCVGSVAVKRVSQLLSRHILVGRQLSFTTIRLFPSIKLQCLPSRRLVSMRSTCQNTMNWSDQHNNGFESADKKANTHYQRSERSPR